MLALLAGLSAFALILSLDGDDERVEDRETYVLFCFFPKTNTLLTVYVTIKSKSQTKR
jgi:hypothetical protein